jgi:hypothetical protein
MAPLLSLPLPWDPGPEPTRAPAARFHSAWSPFLKTTLTSSDHRVAPRLAPPRTHGRASGCTCGRRAGLSWQLLTLQPLESHDNIWQQKTRTVPRRFTIDWFTIQTCLEMRGTRFFYSAAGFSFGQSASRCARERIAALTGVIHR